MLEFAEWLAGTAMGHRIALSGRVIPTSRTMHFATGAGGATTCI